MKIEKLNDGILKFQNLRQGELFSCDDGSGLYIKLNDDPEDGLYNAFAVEDDILVGFEQDENVIPRQGKIVVES